MNHPRPIPATNNATAAGKPTVRIDLEKVTLLPYCRQLIAEGHDPDTIALVYRGETLSFHPTRLCHFAGLTTTEVTTRFVFAGITPRRAAL